MVLASVQTKPRQKDIAGNLDDHYRSVKIAADSGADLIVFPEMSITGYERENALKLSFIEEDSRLDKLRILSADTRSIIIAGAPVKTDSGLYIGSFVVKPDNTISIYIKQFLHEGEDKYFKSSFDYNPLIETDNERISLAICADIDHRAHPENARIADSSIYIASLFWSLKGIYEAHNLLGNYAKEFSMNILMSNYCGKVWGIDAGGRSAFWNSDGNLITTLDDKNTGILMVMKNGDNWIGKNVPDK